MEGLLHQASEFVHDAAALSRCLEVDRQRELRLEALAATLDQFRRGMLSIDELVRRVGAAVREQVPGRGIWLWGFKNEEERAFAERLGQAAARVPEVDLNGVLRKLLEEAETLSDETRVHSLLAFADFVADLDSRGQEGDPRLGVGPSANFLSFCWHVLTDAHEPVFLFETNKAIKAVSEASGDPELGGRSLEGRFRAFYAVARRLEPILEHVPIPMRAGWAVEHALEWLLETIGALPQSAPSDDPGVSALWKPRPRAELRDRPPSGRHPEAPAEKRPSDPTAAAPQADKRPVRIEPPRRASDERPIEKPFEKPAERPLEKPLEKPAEVREMRAARPTPSLRPPKEETPAEPVRVVETPRPVEAPHVAATAMADPKAVTRREKRSSPESGELLTAALGELIGEIATAEAEPEDSPEEEAREETWRSDRLSRDLGFSNELVADVLDAIATRGRVLLVGVPATGKTYLARRLAIHIAGRDERTVFLRMHPSVSYDDLVESRRSDGTFERGVVRELCERAKKERDARFALVIDDADRADMGRVLGELAGALVERGVPVQLSRSRDQVAIPKNLHVIATARTAPNELLGRFPCVEVPPDAEALRRFLARTSSALEWVADVLRETNARLARDRGAQARIGQGFLMDPALDLRRLEGIWRREVLPFVRVLGLDPKDFELNMLKDLRGLPHAPSRSGGPT